VHEQTGSIAMQMEGYTLPDEIDAHVDFLTDFHMVKGNFFQ